MKPIVTVMLIILTTFCQAECPIECYCDRVTVCTGDNLLTRFSKISFSRESSDSNPPYSTYVPIRIELHNFAVTHLHKEDFLDIISNLTEISISRNSLESFDNDTFSFEITPVLPSTPKANTVAIGGNSPPNHKSGVSRSDETQRTFSATRVVSRNQAYSASAENNFLQLRILDLSQNKLKYFVGGGKLRKVKILDLSSNLLQQVYELSTMQNLESINLRDNHISYLEANIFQNLRNLQYVNLDSNVLGLVHPSTFSNLPALAHLILSSNPISNLLPGFYWNSRVQFVDVSNVGLASIPPSLTKTVRDFRCANNNLTIIRQTDFESYPNVGLLVLDENAIEVVEDDAFGRLDFLSRLWMNGNKLKRIPQNLPPSLRSLQLESNRIVNLSSSDFKNLRRLEELNLHGNQINSVPPSVFAELTNLKSLDLRSNLIDVIYRDSFANLSKLQILDISQNPIKVIVTGAFEALRKVNSLHASRLMEPVEFDVATFQPLQNVQTLELDHSSHLTHKLFLDNGFSYMPNLYELNIQNCELDDPNLVCNALIELNLQSVKMNANPWDCEFLHGSSIHELISRRVIVDSPTCAHPQSLKNKVISSIAVTTPSPSFAQENSPEKTDNSASMSSSTTSSEISSDSLSATGQLQPETHDRDSTDISAFPDTTHKQAVSNTNARENLANVSSDIRTGQDITRLQGIGGLSAGLVTSGGGNRTAINRVSFITRTASASESTLLSPNTTLNISSASRQAFGHNHDSSFSATLMGADKKQKVSSSHDVSKATTEINPFADMLDGDGDALPTQSYFDYPSGRGKSKTDETNSDDGDERDSMSVSGGNAGKSTINGTGSKGTNSKVSSSTDGERKQPSISIPILNTAKTSRTGQRTRRPSSQAEVRSSSDETKTNDDNAIIDESRLQRTGREEEQQELADAQRSIDGFPPVYPHDARVANQAPSGSNSHMNNPKYSYLKLNDNSRHQRRSDLPYDNSTDSHHMAVIVKTLVISAFTCLGSILFLFFISFLIYQYSVKRNHGAFSCARRCSREEGEDTRQQEAELVYTRFGRKKSKRRELLPGTGSSIASRYHHHRESDSDQVELSGITNTLYFENEDIYHIT